MKQEKLREWTQHRYYSENRKAKSKKYMKITKKRCKNKLETVAEFFLKKNKTKERKQTRIRYKNMSLKDKQKLKNMEKGKVTQCKK